MQTKHLVLIVWVFCFCFGGAFASSGDSNFDDDSSGIILSGIAMDTIQFNSNQIDFDADADA